MSDREVELVYLDQIRRIVTGLRVEISKLHTEVRDLRDQVKKMETAEWAMRFDKSYCEAVDAIHFPPPAPTPYPMPKKNWWGAPWKTSLG